MITFLIGKTGKLLPVFHEVVWKCVDTPCIYNLSPRLMWMISLTLQSHNILPWVKSPPVHIQQQTGWIPASIWMLWRREKYSPPSTGIERWVLSHPVCSYHYLDWAVLNANYKDLVNSSTITFTLNAIKMYHLFKHNGLFNDAANSPDHSVSSCMPKNV